MDEIELPKEEKNPEFLLRRPSRAERSIDDPIREMDGMFVDEYGRFATFFFLIVFLYNVQLLAITPGVTQFQINDYLG
jgi:hypothetical protein